jgi:DNA-binding NtrC family response regulator
VALLSKRYGQEKPFAFQSSTASAVERKYALRESTFLLSMLIGSIFTGTGIDLAQRMLQIRLGLPIILCTGYSNLVDETQAKARGIKGFAMKSLTRKAIAGLLRDVLEGPEPPKPAPPPSIVGDAL